MSEHPGFDSGFLATEAFQKGLMAVAEKSPTFMQYLNEYVANGGQITLGQKGGGSYCSKGTNTITIDARVLDGTFPAERLVALMGHELGHGLDNAWPASFRAAKDPLSAAKAGLATEGVALDVEYRVATELGSKMYSSLGIPNLQEHFATVEDRVSEGAKLTATAHPSTARNLTYEVYYAASYGFNHSDVSVSRDQWQKMEDSDIKVTLHPEGGYKFEAELPPGRPDFHYTSVISEFDANGELLESVLGYTDFAGSHIKTVSRGEDGELVEKVTHISSLIESALKNSPDPSSMRSHMKSDFNKSVPLHIMEESFDFAGAESLLTADDEGVASESHPSF